MGWHLKTHTGFTGELVLGRTSLSNALGLEWEKEREAFWYINTCSFVFCSIRIYRIYWVIYQENRVLQYVVNSIYIYCNCFDIWLQYDSWLVRMIISAWQLSFSLKISTAWYCWHGQIVFISSFFPWYFCWFCYRWAGYVSKWFCCLSVLSVSVISCSCFDFLPGSTCCGGTSVSKSN